MNFKKISLAALATAALAIGGYAIQYQMRSAVESREEEKVPVVDFSKYSLAGLMNIINEPQHGDHMIGAGKEALARMKEKISLGENFISLAFSRDGKLYALPDDLEEEDFSQLRDDPDKEKGDWTYKGWQADAQGRTIIMYQSNNQFNDKYRQRLSSSPSSPQQETLYLTKQDTYQNGKFMGTFWNFLPAYRDQTSMPKVWNGTAWVEMEGKLFYEGKEVR